MMICVCGCRSNCALLFIVLRMAQSQGTPKDCKHGWKSIIRSINLLYIYISTYTNMGTWIESFFGTLVAGFEGSLFISFYISKWKLRSGNLNHAVACCLSFSLCQLSLQEFPAFKPPFCWLICWSVATELTTWTSTATIMFITSAESNGRKLPMWKTRIVIASNV